MTENIQNHSIENEIKDSYLAYSMSVIVSRALPDARDGLKPVQRRILYAMNDMRLFHNTKFRKSAAVVGEVMGKYHPHGDSSVYEAMVRMSQIFSLRYPLVNGQGNFGSIDGDGAAAMRYTEARLTKIAEEMLGDIDLDTVNWNDNYDNSRQEPVVLPTKLPNLLCNGTMGIAVGMATNMAPHNLNEIIDACLLLIDNPEATIDEIMEKIKGPDFPTGGLIFDHENIKEVYKKGKGSIVMRAKVHFEEIKGYHTIVVDEIPYQLNKSNLMMKIGELISFKKIEGIVDLTDESNKDRIRITIKLRKGVNPNHILTMLYKSTDLQCNFSLNNVVLIESGRQPSLLNIKDLLKEFVNFRRDVVLRRSNFLLKKAKDRLHILEGLQKAIDIIDEVIATIRGSQTRQEAKEKLMKNFEFSEEQTEYILMLRLQTLVGLEIEKILHEIGDKKELIEYLTSIINDPAKLDNVVIDELVYIKDEYGDKRRTELSNDLSVYELQSSMKNLLKLQEQKKENVILRISNDFNTKVLYQSRVNIIPDETYALQYTHNQDKIVVVTNTGELVISRLKDLGSHNMKGKAVNFKETFELAGNIVFANAISADYDYIVMLTNHNNIKKVTKELLLSFKKFPTKIMGLSKGEQIIKVLQVKEGDNIGVLSQNGMMVVYPEEGVRPMGKTAGGVRAIGLEEGDKVASAFVYKDEMFVFIYSKNNGKLVNFEDCKIQRRAQMGLVVADLTKGETLQGGMALDEGSIAFKQSNGKVIELDSRNMRLKNRNTKLDEITKHKIERIYTPWREKIDKNRRIDEAEEQEKLFQEIDSEIKANQGLFGNNKELQKAKVESNTEESKEKTEEKQLETNDENTTDENLESNTEESKEKNEEKQLETNDEDTTDENLESTNEETKNNESETQTDE